MGFAIGMMCSPPVSGLLLQYIGPKAPFVGAAALCVFDFGLRLFCMIGKKPDVDPAADNEHLQITGHETEELTSRPVRKPLCAQLAAMFSYGPVIPLLFMNFMSSFSISALEILYPLFLAHTLDATPGEIGAVFGVVNVCFGVFSFIGGLLADKLGRAPVLVVGTTLFAGALCSISFASSIYVAGAIGVCSTPMFRNSSPTVRVQWECLQAPAARLLCR